MAPGKLRCAMLEFIFISFTLLLSTTALETASVTITNGTIIGQLENVEGHHLWQFLGIPFAQPPTGALRFRRPEPLQTQWQSPLMATATPKACLQLTPRVFRENWPSSLAPTDSEDCLYLNIWTPSLSKMHGKPVMVWIHGGGYTSGESLPLNNGKAFAALGDVVFVSFHYRVGLLGFSRLDDTLVPGNLGLFDQQLALRWVQENIAAFGGDPTSVTLFGESAGSAAVGMHLLNEESSSYFTRAIMMSGSPTSPWAFNPNTEALERVHRKAAASYLDCNQGATQDMLECLQTKSEQEILVAMTRFAREHPSGPYWSPTIDGHFITRSPQELLAMGRFSKKDVVIGVMADEGAYFVQKVSALLTAHKLIPGPIDQILSEQSVAMLVDGMFRYYPYFPNTTSKLMRQIISLKSISYRDPNRPDFNVRALSKTLGNFLINCGVNQMADAMRTAHDNVYFYEFVHRPSTPLVSYPVASWMGATHTDIIPFVFALPMIYPHLVRSMTEDELALSRRLINDFVIFAKTGRPADDKWERYSLEKKQFYRYCLTPQLRTDGVNREECVFWDRVVPLVNQASSDGQKEDEKLTSTPQGAELRKEEL